MSEQSTGPEYPAYPGEGAPAGSVPPPPPPVPSTPIPERPASIRTAVGLMWFGVALSVVSLAFGLTAGESDREAVADAMRDANPDVTQSEIDASYTIGIGFAVFFGIVAMGLWAWMAWKNGQGRSWARIVATVLGGINLAFLTVGWAFADFMATGAGPDIGLVIGGVEAVLAIAVLALLWQKTSSAYYDAVSERQLT